MNSETRRTIDLAVIFTATTGYIYILGWDYWNAYLNYFGIDSTFLTLSVNQIIASTWFVFLLFVLIYLFAVLRIKSSDDNTNQKIIVNRVIILLIGFFICISTFYNKLLLYRYNLICWKIIFWFSVILLFLAFVIKIEKETDGTLEITKNNIIFFFLFIIGCSGFYFRNEGLDKAKYLENRTKQKITIELKESYQTDLIDLILIAHMDGKYFVYKPPFTSNHKVIIINDDQIKRVLINKIID